MRNRLNAKNGTMERVVESRTRFFLCPGTCLSLVLVLVTLGLPISGNLARSSVEKTADYERILLSETSAPMDQRMGQIAEIPPRVEDHARLSQYTLTSGSFNTLVAIHPQHERE